MKAVRKTKKNIAAYIWIRKRRKKLRIPERIRPPATAPIGLILSLGCPTSKKAPNSIKKKEFLKDHHIRQIMRSLAKDRIRVAKLFIDLNI